MFTAKTSAVLSSTELFKTEKTQTSEEVSIDLFDIMSCNTDKTIRDVFSKCSIQDLTKFLDQALFLGTETVARVLFDLLQMTAQQAISALLIGPERMDFARIALTRPGISKQVLKKALIDAIFFEKGQIVTVILDNPRTSQRCLEEAFEYAVTQGNPNIVKVFLDHPKTSREFIEKALRYAEELGFLGVVQEISVHPKMGA